MKIEEKYTTTPDEAQAAQSKPYADGLSFDARLELASAGMDALHAHHHGDAMAEAQTAFEEALKVAETLEPELPVFRSHPILKAAGDLIRVRGWTRGQEEDTDGKLCAIGAIRKVAPGAGSDPEWDAINELMNRIAADLGHENYSIPMWNDTRNNPGEVLKLLY